jgi:hypothetical protein
MSWRRKENLARAGGRDMASGVTNMGRRSIVMVLCRFFVGHGRSDLGLVLATALAATRSRFSITLPMMTGGVALGLFLLP